MSQATALVGSTRQLVVFSLGNEEYALPITNVQEIIRYTEPRVVAAQAHWLRGVISLRGKIIPVCDLAARLGIMAGDGERQKIVIVETANGTAGLIVDDVDEVLTVEDSSLDGVPGSADESTEAIVKLDSRLVVLLNADGVFGSVSLDF